MRRQKFLTRVRRLQEALETLDVMRIMLLKPSRHPNLGIAQMFLGFVFINSYQCL